LTAYPDSIFSRNRSAMLPFTTISPSSQIAQPRKSHRYGTRNRE
jgi:hypothetical protein